MTTSPVFQHSLRPPCLRHDDRGERNRYNAKSTTIYHRCQRSTGLHALLPTLGYVLRRH